MKQIEERVIAYKLAKEIDHKDLEEISGGSMRTTVQVSGYEHSPDGIVDTVFDW